jgi:hypothetical protein
MLFDGSIFTATAQKGPWIDRRKYPARIRNATAHPALGAAGIRSMETAFPSNQERSKPAPPASARYNS